MASGNWPFSDATTVVSQSDHDVFIPELWSDETIAAYMKSIVTASRVKHMSFSGKKKGDTIHIPKPVRGQVFAKVEGQFVTLQSNTAGELVATIDKHYHYAQTIEDFFSVQAIESYRAFYTEDSGYQLAKRVDTDLNALAARFGVASVADWDEALKGDGTAYAPTAGEDTTVDLTDAGLRTGMQMMDDRDVPLIDRHFLVSPRTKWNILGEARYTSSDFVKGNPVMSGSFANLYGAETALSTNMPIITDTGGTTDEQANLLFHKDAICYMEQMGVRTQTSYELQALGTLYVADTIYGVVLYRPECGVSFAVPQSA